MASVASVSVRSQTIQNLSQSCTTAAESLKTKLSTHNATFPHYDWKYKLSELFKVFTLATSDLEEIAKRKVPSLLGKEVAEMKTLVESYIDAERIVAIETLLAVSGIINQLTIPEINMYQESIRQVRDHLHAQIESMRAIKIPPGSLTELRNTGALRNYDNFYDQCTADQHIHNTQLVLRVAREEPLTFTDVGPWALVNKKEEDDHHFPDDRVDVTLKSIEDADFEKDDNVKQRARLHASLANYRDLKTQDLGKLVPLLHQFKELTTIPKIEALLKQSSDQEASTSSPIPTTNDSVVDSADLTKKMKERLAQVETENVRIELLLKKTYEDYLGLLIIHLEIYSASWQLWNIRTFYTDSSALGHALTKQNYNWVQQALIHNLNSIKEQMSAYYDQVKLKQPEPEFINPPLIEVLDRLLASVTPKNRANEPA